jgi:branched-chain amino acid transport system substrate-binding protein
MEVTMRRKTRVDRRIVIAVVSLALTASACTITGPRVTLEGAGGVGPGNGLVAGNGSTSVLGTKITGSNSSFNSSVSGIVATGAAAQACVGKNTDVGITGDTIKLGSTFAISGPVSSISGPILKGVLAYINDVNANGGINGRKIDFTYYDDGWDAQRGKAAIKKLVEQDKVFSLVAVPSSNGLDAATNYLEQARVPAIGTTGLIESQFRSPMIWPIGASSRSAVRIGLMDAVGRLHAKTFAILWLDLLAGEEAHDALIKSLQSGFMGLKPEALVADRRININEPSFEQVWNDIQQQARNHGVADGKPDYVLLAIDPTNAIKAMQGARNLLFKPMVGWGGSAPLFLDLVPEQAPYAIETGLYAGTAFFPPVAEFANMPAVQTYVQTVNKYYAGVDLNNPYLEGGFAGAALAVSLLKTAGPCLTRETIIKLANAVSKLSAAGLTNPLTFQPYGTGVSHYGNVSGLVVQLTPSGQNGCNNSKGFCWTPIHASSNNPFYVDPYPGQ